MTTEEDIRQEILDDLDEWAKPDPYPVFVDMNAEDTFYTVRDIVEKGLEEVEA